MKTILTGNKKLYDRLAGQSPGGFVKVTTRQGTPIMYVAGIPVAQLWVVDVQQQIDLLGGEFGYVTIDDCLEVL